MPRLRAAPFETEICWPWTGRSSRRSGASSSRRSTGEFTVKRIVRHGRGLARAAEREGFAPLPVGEEAALRIWGVVTYTLHAVG